MLSIHGMAITVIVVLFRLCINCQFSVKYKMFEVLVYKYAKYLFLYFYPAIVCNNTNM